MSNKDLQFDEVPLVKKPVLALVMMVKNEKKRIIYTLQSAVKVVDKMIIMDTGSEDGTVEIIKKFTKENNIELDIFVQTFDVPFDFSKARNTVISRAEDKADYILLMDCNDELKNGVELRKFVDCYKGECTCFHICQEWWTGNTTKYYNTRLLKTKSGWRYRAPIHEFIDYFEEFDSRGKKVDRSKEHGRVPKVILYQDRTLDDDKSAKRFHNDRQVFDKEFKEDLKRGVEHNARSLFYYGQTQACIKNIEEAYRLYMERTYQEQFGEERYTALLRCGEMAVFLGHHVEEVLTWYIKAYEYSCNINLPMAEPLYKLAQHYTNTKSWDLAFIYLKRCCELEYPVNSILFVGKETYLYSRWFLMSIVGFYSGNKEIGMYAAVRAFLYEEENKRDTSITKKNLSFYLKDEKLVEPPTEKQLAEKVDILLTQARDNPTGTLELWFQEYKKKSSRVDTSIIPLTEEEQRRKSLKEKLQTLKEKRRRKVK